MMQPREFAARLPLRAGKFPEPSGEFGENGEDCAMFYIIAREAAYRGLLGFALIAVATPAFSQVTEAQRSAIRAACRADYEAHCASVKPGGAQALQCLQKNMTSLSSACQTAVRAVNAPAPPKSEPTAPAKADAAPAATNADTAPAAAAKTDTAPASNSEPAPAGTGPAPTSKPAQTAAAKKPSPSQIAAVRTACRSDYPQVCAGVPTGGAAALQCLEKNKSKISAQCEQAVSAVRGAAGTSSEAATAGPPAQERLVLRPMRPMEELRVVRSACGADIRSLCADVQPGGGRIAHCLASNAGSLSPACKDALAPFAAR
jgi:cysteine rich repeat protein